MSYPFKFVEVKKKFPYKNPIERGHGDKKPANARKDLPPRPPFDVQTVTDPDAWIVPPFFSGDTAERLYNFALRPDDVWIVTPPKCGTTWMQELLWLLMNDMDFDKAKALNQIYRTPFIDVNRPFEDDKPEDVELLERTNENVKKFFGHGLYFAERLESPRLIKSHQSLSLLPPGLGRDCKVVYVARNIKDACVSMYYMQNKPCEFDYYARSFMAGEQMPGDWIKHMSDAFEKQNDKLLFVWYEDMKEDLGKVIERVAEFLGKVVTAEQKQLLLEHLDIDSFRKNRAVNKMDEVPMKEDGSFVRKGIVGDWKNHFSEELLKEWDPWMREKLGGTNLKMRFE